LLAVLLLACEVSSFNGASGVLARHRDEGVVSRFSDSSRPK
jgi:hypothetical protein